MKYNVLFVDDDRRIRDGLQRSLQPYRDELDCRFASSGTEALALLGKGNFHVIVADMIMPGMNGAELLGEVRRKHPGVVRMILSRHAEKEKALRALPVAHQFLSKPCNPDRLSDLIRRSADLHILLKNDDLVRMVGSVGSLPSLPGTYASLTAALADPASSIGDVASIVERDPAMVAKILQLVNSAYFGLGRRLNSIHDAVGYLGINMVRNLTLSLQVFQPFGDDCPPGYSPEETQQHSLLVANMARNITREEEARDDAFLAGILHDIGKLLIATRRSAEFCEFVRESRESGVPLVAVEAKHWGVTHAQIGAYLLGLWGLPLPIVEAVAHHHFPERVRARKFDLVGALWIANQLIHEQRGDRFSTLNLEYLQRFKLAQSLDEWRVMAEGTMEESG